ncbi:MAG: transcription elongation factor GreA, partial [Coriobacteriaceae bacterium]|nr:transcription elongation factor GreA [Coriobacteriaceae bacterium]
MDNSKEITLTAEGRQKLVDELAYREGELRDEIVERLKEARSFGDLSENSEYDAAKEEQSQNESKISEIRQTLSVARVVDDAQRGGIRVSIGTTVE